MTESILLTVKKMLGIDQDYHAFDIDIVVHINSVFLTLYQLGIGPKTPYEISGDEETWEDFYGSTPIPGVKSYVYLKVRLLFDPPTNSFLVQNMKDQIAEFEWRLNVHAEPSHGYDTSEGETGEEESLPEENRNLATPWFMKSNRRC